MTFSHGLIKIAVSPGSLAAGVLKHLKSGVQATSKAVKGAISKSKLDYARGMAKNPNFGEGAAKARIEKMKRSGPVSQEKAQKVTSGIQSDVLERKKRSAKYFQGQKPSFASSHPKTTIALTAGATHLAFGGGGDEKEKKGPPVVYGQGY